MTSQVSSLYEPCVHCPSLTVLQQACSCCTASWTCALLTSFYSHSQATTKPAKPYKPVPPFSCSEEGTEEMEEMGQKERRETQRHVDRRETKDNWGPQDRRGAREYLDLEALWEFLAPRVQMETEESVVPLAWLGLKENRDHRDPPQVRLYKVLFNVQYLNLPHSIFSLHALLSQGINIVT